MRKDARRLYSALSYLSLWWVGLIGSGKKCPDARFHIGQGMMLTIFKTTLLFSATIITHSANTALTVDITNIPTWMLHFNASVWLIVGVLILILTVAGIVNALRLKQKFLPLIGRQAFFGLEL